MSIVPVRMNSSQKDFVSPPKEGDASKLYPPSRDDGSDEPPKVEVVSESVKEKIKVRGKFQFLDYSDFRYPKGNGSQDYHLPGYQVFSVSEKNTYKVYPHDGTLKLSVDVFTFENVATTYFLLHLISMAFSILAMIPLIYWFVVFPAWFISFEIVKLSLSLSMAILYAILEGKYYRDKDIISTVSGVGRLFGTRKPSYSAGIKLVLDPVSLLLVPPFILEWGDRIWSFVMDLFYPGEEKDGSNMLSGTYTPLIYQYIPLVLFQKFNDKVVLLRHPTVLDMYLWLGRDILSFVVDCYCNYFEEKNKKPDKRRRSGLVVDGYGNIKYESQNVSDILNREPNHISGDSGVKVKYV